MEGRGFTISHSACSNWVTSILINEATNISQDQDNILIFLELILNKTKEPYNTHWLRQSTKRHIFPRVFDVLLPIYHNPHRQTNDKLHHCSQIEDGHSSQTQISRPNKNAITLKRYRLVNTLPYSRVYFILHPVA